MSADAEIDWDTMGLLAGSSHRASVLRALASAPTTPAHLAEDTGIPLSNVSLALSDLREAGLVELLVDEATKKGRYYGITDAGVAAIRQFDDEPPEAEGGNVPDDPTEYNWDGIGWVTSSQYRGAAIDVLAEGPATPSQIAESTGLAISHISRALNRMADRGYTELLVSEDLHKGRYYGLTDEGRTLARAIENLEDGESA